MDDIKIIELLFARSQQAITELDAKYGRLCKKLCHNILNDLSDAEECVNEAYLGVWNTVPPEKPNPLQAYICKIARNLALKRHYYKSAEKRSSKYQVAMAELEDYLPSAENVEALVDAKELTKALEHFLDSLNAQNRIIFMRRYWFGDSYKEISDLIGISEKNVSVRLARVRQGLKEFLQERSIFV